MGRTLLARSRLPDLSETAVRRYRPAIAASSKASLAAFVLVSVLLIGGCGGSSANGPTTTAAPTEVPAGPLIPGVAPPGALLAEPDGSLLVGDRLSGEIRRVTLGPSGPTEVLVANVVTSGSVDDQRGLLGLARTSDGRLFVSFTRAPDGRLVVAELSGETLSRLVWEGPVSSQLANGGRLVATTEGLVIGIGDLLEDRALADDSTVPNRKILLLDPDGPSSQVPKILSTGWNNPFALALDADGRVWVADNTGAEGPERLGRADRPAAAAAALGGPGEGEAAPAGLVALDGSFARCGYLTGRVDRLTLDRDGRTATVEALAEPCRTAVIRLSTGQLVMGADDGLVITLAPVS